jgi:hypothetical protein
MKKHLPSLDHIDPKWEEGRDYQLVCGLDCPLNYREVVFSENARKNNRFLPWRWSRDELGVVPEEPGDLAWFLVEEEWVLMEFLGPEWFEASKHTRGICQPDQLERLRSQAVEANQKSQEFWSQAPREKVLERGRKAYANQPEEARQRARVNGGKARGNLNKIEGTGIFSVPKEEADEMRRRNNNTWYRCLETGFVSTAPALAKYQKNRGIDTSRREKLTPEEAALFDPGTPEERARVRREKRSYFEKQERARSKDK